MNKGKNRGKRIVSIAMLLTVVMQLSYPLTSKAVTFIAKEVEENMPQTVYTLDDFMSNKDGKLYSGEINNNEENTLSYSIQFNEFSESTAELRVNNETVEITPEEYSNKLIEGTTNNSIEYTLDPTGLNKNIIDSLEVVEAPNSQVEVQTPDTGDITVDDTQTPDTGDITVDNTQTPDTGDITVDTDEIPALDDEAESSDESVDPNTQMAVANSGGPYFDATTEDGIQQDDPSSNVDATNSTLNDSTPYSGGSSSGEGAIIANDAVVFSRINNFDGCYQYDAGTDGDIDGSGHSFSQYRCTLTGVTPTGGKGLLEAKASPSGVNDILDVMNVQIRDEEGRFVKPTAGNIDSADLINYQMNMNHYHDAPNTGFGLGDDDQTGGAANDSTLEFDNDSSQSGTETLGPVNPDGDSLGVSDAVANYNFHFKYNNLEVESTLTVVDPFYVGSLYTTNVLEGIIGNANDNHAFGNAWGAYKEYNAMLDMVLDVPWERTESSVDGDDPYDIEVTTTDGNTEAEKAVTDAGYYAYTLSSSDSNNDGDFDNDRDEISGYQVNVPRGSDDEDDDAVDTDFLFKYFNYFALTVSEGADNEVDDRMSSTNITDKKQTNNGYTAKQYDNSEDEYGYSEENAYCVKETVETDSHLYDPGNPSLGSYDDTHVIRSHVNDRNCGDTNGTPSNFSTDGSPYYPNSNVGHYPLMSTNNGTTYYWHEDNSFNGTASPQDAYVPYYGTRKGTNDDDSATITQSADVGASYETVALDTNNELNQDQEIFKTILPADNPLDGVSVIDDGGYDNDIPGLYQVVVGYRTDITDGATIGCDRTDFENPSATSVPADCGIQNIGQQDVYMILPVLVAEPTHIAADDTEVWDHVAPQNEKQLMDVMDVEALLLKGLNEEDANKYDEDYYCGNTDAPYDENGHYGNGNSTSCEKPIDEQHYVNNRIDDVQVVNHSNYNYDNPQVGEYLFTFYVDSPMGVPGELDEADDKRDAMLYVKHDWEDIHNADLEGTTPIAVNSTAFEDSDTMYDVIEQMDLTMVYSDNLTINDANDDLDTDDIYIIEDGGYEDSKEQGSIVVLEGNYDGLDIQGLFEIQNTADGKPYESSNQLTLEAIQDLTVPVGDDFEPTITTNPTIYDKDGITLDAELVADFDLVSEDIPTKDNPYELGLQARQLIQGDYYATTYKLVDVYVTDVDENDRVKLAVTDAKSRGAFSADDVDEFKEMMDVEALDYSGEDITDFVDVFDTDGFVYGDTKTVGTPYEITFGVTDPTTGVTFTDTGDYTVIGNNEYLPDVNLKGTEPVYVKTGDEVDEEKLLELINGQIELYRNYEFYGLDDTDMHIVNSDGYDPNSSDTYFVEVGGTYDEDKSEIDPMDAEGIFEVIVDPDVETTTVPVVIEGVEDIHLELNDEFDPLSGVTATSQEDGDITEDIEILANDVDTEEDGNYAVTYYVEDSTGAYAEVERQVAVGDATLEEEADAEENTDVDANADTEADVDSNDATNSDATGALSTSNDKDSDSSDEEITSTLTNTANTNILALMFIVSILGLTYAYASKKIIK